MELQKLLETRDGQMQRDTRNERRNSLINYSLNRPVNRVTTHPPPPQQVISSQAPYQQVPQPPPLPTWSKPMTHYRQVPTARRAEQPLELSTPQHTSLLSRQLLSSTVRTEQPPQPQRAHISSYVQYNMASNPIENRNREQLRQEFPHPRQIPLTSVFSPEHLQAVLRNQVKPSLHDSPYRHHDMIQQTMQYPHPRQDFPVRHDYETIPPEPMKLHQLSSAHGPVPPQAHVPPCHPQHSAPQNHQPHPQYQHCMLQQQQPNEHDEGNKSFPCLKESYTLRGNYNLVSFQTKFYIPEIEEFGRNIIESCQNVDKSLYEAIKVKDQVMPALQEKNAALRKNLDEQQHTITTLQQDKQQLAEKMDMAENAQDELQVKLSALEKEMQLKDKQVSTLKTTLTKTKGELSKTKEELETRVDDMEKLKLQLQTKHETIVRIEGHQNRLRRKRVMLKNEMLQVLVKTAELRNANTDLYKDLMSFTETVEKQDQEMMGLKMKSGNNLYKPISAKDMVARAMEGRKHLINYVATLESTVKEMKKREPNLEEFGENVNKIPLKLCAQPETAQGIGGKRQWLTDSNKKASFGSPSKKMKTVFHTREQQQGESENQRHSGSKKIIIPHLKYLQESKVVAMAVGRKK